METRGYGIKTTLQISFDETLERVTEALKSQGFGILTEIDVKATMKKKLDVQMDNYRILGACNPPFAHKALTAEKDIGLLLPCNVIIYEKEGHTVVSAINPMEAMSVVKNEKMLPIAKQVTEKLTEAIRSLEG